MSLGIKIGVGSIVGITSSIIIGGYGSVIWMILFSILTSSLIYYESILGKNYSINGSGGPYYILKYGVKTKYAHILSLILLIITYCFLFQMVQSNTITNILNYHFKIPKYILTIIFVFLILLMYKYDTKKIIEMMDKLVPLMCVLFVGVSIYAIISNIDILINNIKLIDFNFKSFLSGAIIGIKRSIFMNETLIGTTSLSSSIDSNDTRTSALLQTCGSYFISFISILITLILIIYNKTLCDYNLLIINAYLFSSNKIGLFIIIVCIILFGFTTILSGYYIGISNMNKKTKKIFDLLFLSFIILSIYIKNNFLWDILDYLIFIMIIINSYSIIKLIRSDNNDRK